MLSMELELAAGAPHDLVLMDGSLLTPLIRFNQAVTRLKEVPEDLAKIFQDRIGDALENYREVLASRRSDRIYALFQSIPAERRSQRDSEWRTMKTVPCFHSSLVAAKWLAQ
jgi:hypothetical protein